MEPAGDMPLLLIAVMECGNVALAQRLLEAGAHGAVCHPGDGRTVVQCALQCNNRAMLALAMSAWDNAVTEPMLRCGPVHHALVAERWDAAAFIATLQHQPGSAVSRSVAGGVTPLAVAAALGLSDAVDALVAAGASMDALDDCGASALHYAAANGSVPLMAKLVAWEPGHLDRSTYHGWTPLMYAVWNGHLPAVQWCLERGCNPCSADSATRCTPLHMAAQRGHAGTMEALLAAGADARAVDKLDGTAAHEAAIAGHCDCLRLLMDAAPELLHAVAGNGGGTPLCMAAYRNLVPVVEWLLERGARVDDPTDDGETALMCAAREGAVAAAEMLLAAGADVRAMDVEGLSAVHLAAVGGSVPVMQAILARQPAEEWVALLSTGGEEDPESTQPLMLAAVGGNADMVAFILQQGVPVDQSPDDRTALTEALRHSHNQCAHVLLAAGADVHRWVDGLSTLHLAAVGCSPDVISALLGAGLSPTAVSGVGARHTPVRLAVQHGNVAAIPLLVSPGTVNLADQDGFTALHAAAAYDHAGMVDALVGAGADVNAVSATEACETALHIACSRRRLDNVRRLCELGADLELANDQGCTPLLHAAMLDDSRFVTELLRRGARPTARSSAGMSALHFSAGRGHHRTLRALLLHGDLAALVNALDAHHTTPLAIAAGRGYRKAAALLLRYGADPLTPTPLRVNADAGTSGAQLAPLYQRTITWVRRAQASLARRPSAPTLTMISELVAVAWVIAPAAAWARRRVAVVESVW